MTHAPETRRRRTFAIISHPDAGKTTLTEKLLLFSGAIQSAGTVKGKKSGKFATSDWMEIEKQRGISVASSVMQFTYDDCVINLLDTTGLNPHQLTTRVGERFAPGGQLEVTLTVMSFGFKYGTPVDADLIAEIDAERTADDRLDAVTCNLFGELQSAEHVVGVGQRQRWLLVGLGELRELADRHRAFEQRIGGMDVQMHKAGISGHEGPQRFVLCDGGDAGRACPWPVAAVPDMCLFSSSRPHQAHRSIANPAGRLER